MFSITYISDEDNFDSNFKITRRIAVKGIIKKDGKILLINTNKGDYKFPGGGIKKNESIEQALKREIEEETGFKLKFIGKVLGKVFERRLDQYEPETIFEMESIYILCDLDYKEVVKQKLDTYEAEQEFQPIFIALEDALENNLQCLKNNKDINSWVRRETDVISKLIEMWEK
ncbi:NUDIX domain-containing protein [Defluviitalea phaphyphila]|uniref:NUDIX domain-containing protein n=1 Tax=Defluviitalea phaphyphila TaxID=1473580 RepID=UPI0007303C70|nr:NUDIX domain-containing protein [Defluviitalea phaphyphila]